MKQVVRMRNTLARARLDWKEAAVQKGKDYIDISHSSVRKVRVRLVSKHYGRDQIGGPFRWIDPWYFESISRRSYARSASTCTYEWEMRDSNSYDIRNLMRW